MSVFGDAVEALTYIYDALVSLPETLISVLIAITYLLLYPAVCLVNLVYGWVVGLVGPCVEIIRIIYGLGSGSLTSIVGVFGEAFPSSWLVLLGLIVGLNVALRVYYLIKGISIFGWSL